MGCANRKKRVRIVVAVIRDECGRCLVVKKSGAVCFVQPGGEPQPEESPLDTLDREILDDLGCGIDRETAEFDGFYSVPSANETDTIVDAMVYRVSLINSAVPRGEVEQIVWLNPNDPHGVLLAPLTEFEVLPRYKKWVKPSLKSSNLTQVGVNNAV